MLFPIFMAASPGPTPTVAEMDTVLAECLKKDDTTVGMMTCQEAAHVAMDRRLNEVYQKLLLALPAESREPLKAAQRAWLTWRDAENKLAWAASPFQGGSLQQVEVSARSYAILRQRTLELEAYLAGLDPEGH